MNYEQLLATSQPFLAYVAAWKSGLPPLPITEMIDGDASKVAIISVDVINGFCYEGPLASPRVASIVDPVVTLFQKSFRAGVRQFVLTQDAHPENAVEFETFPAHCLSGTRESQAVEKIQQLPFFGEFQVIPKNSLNSLINTKFTRWLEDHPYVETFVTVGDCTDLCTYQLAMHLKLRANARNERVRVIVPADCIETYDLPVDLARQIGAIPHAGDLLHHIFLYHMMLNGIEVVARVA